MSVKVIFAGGRWLGMRCLEHVLARTDINLLGAYVPEPGWDGTDGPAELERLGVHQYTEYDLRALLTNGHAELCLHTLTSHIFTARELAGCDLGIINLHPAPLPYYRGCNSYAHAILNGDRTYGVTLHYMTEQLDAGPIIARDWLAIEPGDTGHSLYWRAQCVAVNMFARELGRIMDQASWCQRIPDVLEQDERLVRYYPRDSLVELKDATGLDGDELDRRVRALDFPPFAPAYVTERDGY